MHFTVKKTLQQLVEGGNHYVVAVKGNQGTLKKHFEACEASATPELKTTTLDCSHSRWVERYLRVYDVPDAVSQSWPHARSMIVLERYGIRENQTFSNTSYYLSDRLLSAASAAHIIRQHRDIENGLHWVRDVVLDEDHSRITTAIPALNWAVLRSIVLNLFRAAGRHSLTTAMRMMAHDIPALISILITN